MKTVRTRLFVAGMLLAGVIGGSAVLAQSGTGPEARYVMDAGTIAGMMGQGDHHELTLRLGSRLAPTGAPKADHFMPAGARLGASVPLETPVRATGETLPTNFQQPRGRLLLFWGCGAKAGPGQPLVLDFSKLAKGQTPPGLFSAKVPADLGPTLANSRSYGDWPNSQKSKSLSAQSSLLGAHRIAGTYSPEIAFTLDQDFMSALHVRSSTNGDGSTGISWQGLGNATGYHAWVMGGKDMGKDGADMVWWSSSATREFGGGLWSWLAPATVARLVGQNVVMAPSQTSCTVPAEVKQAAGGMMMGFLYAYGPEADFAFPARPANPRVAWKPKWTATVRYRSMGMFMPGMPSMSDMLRGRDDGQGDTPAAPKKCKPRGLGGMLKKAAGVGC